MDDGSFNRWLRTAARPTGYRVVNAGGTLVRLQPKVRGKAARRLDKRRRRLERAREAA